ncbi:MAG: hypothetical protein K8F54_10590 [Altibacter sp.]|uniref:hypothetical protein n=1 Tax=Altibacter sp. TaxID=2024823 RepID=UPI001E0ED92C|nr:hypothetical protein [Altibacter sp.]MBZ0328042.1 hypothetical protein [Altibacter sp.]
MIKSHSFHIPVMGIGFTIDTPLKVSHFGIDSVISLVDDILLERLRKMYSIKFEIPYKEITNKMDDFRAKRITAYLNLIKSLAEKKFEDLKNDAINNGNEIKKYFNMLPETSSIKQEFKRLTANCFNLNEMRDWINETMTMGAIDVNVMTKVDKDNYKKDVKLPIEFNDAHAALRGFANSDLNSSIVLSAGMNPRLYSYMEQFDDFYPDEQGAFKKKIILKVSDYRSALIQGKFLAKKGIWVSEYRVESGLNCGGHAFATDGYLLGPVLFEFKQKRLELVQSIQEILVQALKNKNRILPKSDLKIKITAQGGVGTAEEHDFLIDHYQVDSVGWGTPFLLVPEATCVDKETLRKLMDAREADLYLSDVSPLGVPFHNLKGNTKDVEKLNLIEKGRPGSSCPKKFVALNKEFKETGICTASREYQYLKLKELDKEQLGLSEHQHRKNKIIEKSCTCVGLGTSALLVHNLDTKVEGKGVSICPGPNMAYFSKIVSLKEITGHIYGKLNVIKRTDRPNMFINELNIYIDYLRKKILEAEFNTATKQGKYLTTFVNNLNEGVMYYAQLVDTSKIYSKATSLGFLKDLEDRKKMLCQLTEKISELVLTEQRALFPSTK